MEGFVEPHKYQLWLVDAFFRLHRRRMHGEAGFQPISFNDMAAMADKVLRVSEDLRPLFFRVMENTDNAVLHDHYGKQKEAADAAAKDIPKPKKSRRR